MGNRDNIIKEEKATGIIRRIDDLGRVVIPKEIRRMMMLSEGDPMEIYVTKDGVCFKKYDSSYNAMDLLEHLNDSIQDIDVLKINSFEIELESLMRRFKTMKEQKQKEVTE
jgi:AbrB family transcriptional regulator (stage V sporulation protein T)